MATITMTRQQQQSDLLAQLEKDGVATTETSSASLETLKKNSRLAEEMLGLVEEGIIKAWGSEFGSSISQKPW